MRCEVTTAMGRAGAISPDLLADRIDANREQLRDHETRLRTVEFRLARVAATAALAGSAIPHLIGWIWKALP